MAVTSGVGDLGGGLGLIDRILTHRFRLQHACVAVELLLRERRLRALLAELRLQIVQIRAILAHRRLIDGRIDLRDEIALVDAIADLHMDLFHAPGHLRADIDIFFGLERSDRGHGLFQIAELDGGRTITGLRILLQVLFGADAGGDGERGERSHPKRQPLASRSGAACRLGVTFCLSFDVHVFAPWTALTVSCRTKPSVGLDCGDNLETLWNRQPGILLCAPRRALIATQET